MPPQFCFFELKVCALCTKKVLRGHLALLYPLANFHILAFAHSFQNRDIHSKV